MNRGRQLRLYADLLDAIATDLRHEAEDAIVCDASFQSSELYELVGACKGLGVAAEHLARIAERGPVTRAGTMTSGSKPTRLARPVIARSALPGSNPSRGSRRQGSR